MAHRLSHMADSRRNVTDEEIINLLKSGTRPVWTNTALAEETDITRQTAHGRLKRLAERSDEIATIDVGQATAYYIPGVNPLPPGDSTEERHKQSIIQWATDTFVGLETAPWTARHPNDGPLTGGDKIQTVVEGTPNNWDRSRIHPTLPWEDRREELHRDELDAEITQALVSGELYERPTTPIEHTNYPPEYDLELNLGVQEVETDKGTAFVAAGVKNHLIRPCDNAVFLKDVEVDWISPKGEGQELETWGFDASGESADMELIEDAQETIEEKDNEDYYGGDEPGL